MTNLPRIAVIGTGGTISGVGRDRLDFYEYGTSGRFMHVDELIAGVPELARVADVVPIGYKNVGSTEIGPSDWLALLRIINKTVADDPSVAGIVVTHGTATLEETAYFLNLAVKVPVPVVVVGAMRPSSALGADGGNNLLNGARVAGSPQAKGMGVMVVLNDEINAARDVAKTSNYRVQTFVSRDFGMLGYADADSVKFYRRPLRVAAPETEFDVAGLSELPRVDIVPAYAGADAAFVEAAVAAGAKGIGGVSIRIAVSSAEDGVEAGGQGGHRGGAVVPVRQRAGDRRQGGAAGGRVRRRRQPDAAEGAHPADDGVDGFIRYQRDKADVRYLLKDRPRYRSVSCHARSSTCWPGLEQVCCSARPAPARGWSPRWCRANGWNACALRSIGTPSGCRNVTG
jgi:L-asparaginase